MTMRSDIQGLRALAVTLVLLNHINVLWLSGGYIGVDVFFVISGFLITSGILREYDQNYRLNGGAGWFSLRAFYLRRIRRILPAALLVLTVTVVFSFVFFNSLKAQRILIDSIWSGLFLANFHFIKIQTDYFQQTYSASPLQHFWSLAVEEQFYLFFPTLLLACMSLRGLHLFGFRLNWRKRVGLVTFLVTMISFFWALAASNSNPSSSYFSTFSRIWELGIGALLALFAQSGAKVLPLLIRNVMSVSGFLMILTSAFVFTSSTPFPGLYTLFPTIGTALIIRAGMNSGHQVPSLIEKVSGFPPILFLGNISYSAYLWHLPIIVFSSEFYENSNFQLFSKLLILALILLLSSLTYIFIEKPTQMKIKVPSSWYAKKYRPSDSFLKGVSFPKFHIDKIVIVSILFLVLSFTLVQLPVHKIANPEDGTYVPIESTQSARLGSAAVTKSYNLLQSEWMEKVREGNDLRTIPNITAPSLNKLSADWEKYQFTDYVSNLPDAKTVYIYGDSIAGRFPVFSKMVFNGWNQHIRSLPGCGVPRNFSGVQGVGFDGFDCNGEWNKLRTEIIEKNPDLVIVISGLDKGGDLEKTIAFLAKNSKNLLYLSGRPAQVSLTDCLEDKSTLGKDCFGFQDDAFLKYKEFERTIVESNKSIFLDYSQWLCDNRKCPPVIDQKLVFLDDLHPSTPILMQISNLFLSYAKENSELSKILFDGAEFREGDTAKALNSPQKSKVNASITDTYLKSLTNWQEKIFEGSNLQKLPPNLNPPLSKVNDLSIYWRDCFGDTNEVSCTFGNPTARRTAIVMGDSFAIATIPMVVSALGSKDWKVVALTKGQCMISDVTPVIKNSSKVFSECPSFRNWAFDYIKKNPPELIVLSDQSDISISGPDGVIITRPGSTGNRFWAQQLDYSLSKIAAVVGGKFVYFSTLPATKPFVDCVEKDLSLLKNCAGKPSGNGTSIVIQNQLTTKYGGLFVKSSDWVCYKSICPLIIDNSPVRPDGSHLGEALAKKLGLLFREKLLEKKLI